MDKWECLVCGYVYDPAVGDPDSGIEPGTPFGRAHAAEPASKHGRRAIDGRLFQGEPRQ